MNDCAQWNWFWSASDFPLRWSLRWSIWRLSSSSFLELFFGKLEISVPFEIFGMVQLSLVLSDSDESVIQVALWTKNCSLKHPKHCVRRTAGSCLFGCFAPPSERAWVSCWTVCEEKGAKPVRRTKAWRTSLDERGTVYGTMWNKLMRTCVHVNRSKTIDSPWGDKFQGQPTRWHYATADLLIDIAEEFDNSFQCWTTVTNQPRLVFTFIPNPGPFLGPTKSSQRRYSQRAMVSGVCVNKLCESWERVGRETFRRNDAQKGFGGGGFQVYEHHLACAAGERILRTSLMCHLP